MIDIRNHRPSKVLHFQSLSEGLRFEYHPETKRIYLIVHKPGTTVDLGELLAQEVEDINSAQNCIRCFVHGYKRGKNRGENQAAEHPEAVPARPRESNS